MTLKLLPNYKIQINHLFIVGILFILTSCSREVEKVKNTSGFYRENMMVRYLKDIHNFKFDTDFTLVLVNSSDCGACNVKDFKKVQEDSTYLKSNNVYYLFSKKSPKLLNEIIFPEKIKTLLDTNYVLDKYGLRLYSTYIFHFEKDQIKNWEKITNPNFTIVESDSSTSILSKPN